MKSNPNLDLLRSIAVLLVVVEHILLAMHVRWIGSWDTSWVGVVGVFIFFVHTSLVLMWSMERKPHPLDFYIRRVFRIYPLAIAAIMAIVVLHIPTMQNVNGDTYYISLGVRHDVVNLLLIQNLVLTGSILGVMWTLPLEVQMYFILPYLFFFVRKNFVIWPLLTLLAAIALFDVCTFPADNNSILTCIPYFLCGVLAYVLFGKVRPRLPAFVMPVLVGLLLSCFMIRPSFRAGWLLTLVLGLALPLFHPIRAQWLVRSSHHVAKYSYGIYLAHPFCITIGVYVLSRFNLAIRLTGIFVSLVAIVVPAYHLLEKPMIDLGARLADRVERKVDGAVVAGE